MSSGEPSARLATGVPLFFGEAKCFHKVNWSVSFVSCPGKCEQTFELCFAWCSFGCNARSHFARSVDSTRKCGKDASGILVREFLHTVHSASMSCHS